mgnify:CR=1 FL=1
MKKRVCSILLAAVLCLTLLPAAAWAEETGTNGDETCTHTDWEYIDDEEGQRHIQQCKNCPQKTTPTDCIHREGTTKGKCEICGLDLAVSLNDWTGGRCVTTWEKAFSHVGSSKYYPITDITENVTLNNVNGEPLKIHMAGYKATGKITVQSGTLELYLNPAEDRDKFASTISEIEVTGGTLNVTGNELLTIEKLTVNGGTVQLFGGTYGTITPPAGKSVNDLLAPGYYAVQTANGISVQQAPITNVTVSVSNNDNTVYGYSEADAPVLTATVTPSDLQGVTYQWYKVNGSKKTAIDNATAQTYTVETGLNAGDYDYCCTATVGTYSLTSEEVKVTIAKADGPQLGTINVNQVYNDTASKTINIYDYIGTELNQLEKNAGKLRFHSGTYSPENTIKSGWGVDVDTGAITYQLVEGLSVGQTITITMQVGYNDQAYSNNHEDATVTVNITLTMATPTGTPNYTPITSSGKTLADAHLNADNGVFSVPGTVKWVGETDELDPSTVPVEKDKAYTWKFTPQLDNYESITGSIILWTESGSGVVIIVPSQSGESTPASNPNTGATHVGQPLPGLALLVLAALCLYAGTRRF